MTTQATTQTVEVTEEAKRQALIEQLCDTRGSQYQGLKKYRSL